MAEFIRLEPHAEFRHAIIKTSAKGRITYDYMKLIAVCMRINDWDDETATEWVDYNIVGLQTRTPANFIIIYPR